MSNKINVICDICGHQIPYIAKSGYCVENGCKYISAVIKNTVPAPPNTHQEEKYYIRYLSVVQTGNN